MSEGEDSPTLDVASSGSGSERAPTRSVRFARGPATDSDMHSEPDEMRMDAADASFHHNPTHGPFPRATATTFKFDANASDAHTSASQSPRAAQQNPVSVALITLLSWPLVFLWVGASLAANVIAKTRAFMLGKRDEDRPRRRSSASAPPSILQHPETPPFPEPLTQKDRRKLWKRYNALLCSATCYPQYEEAARALDHLEGRDVWKNDPVSSDYDYRLIEDRLSQLRWLGQKGDVTALSFLLRTSLSRNLGDMGNTKLYGHARVGTKRLIHEYIDEVVKQLNYLADADSPEFQIADKILFFRNIQRSFGTTALLLSGGATFGMVHCGVLKALYEASALPRIVSGSSAGSIVAAILCTQTEDNFETAMDPHLTNRDFYEDPSEVGNIFPKLYRLMNHGCVFDVESFIKAAKANLGGDITFQEAYNKSRRVLNMAVSSSTQFEMPRLLNYLTSPNVVIWSAVAASCALPFMYRSAPLMFKTSKHEIDSWNPSGHRWIDGSVEGDLPMTRISELFDVNHFIVCQVNPHIMPFLNKSLSETWILRAANNLAYLIKSEALHRLNQLSELGINWNPLHRLKSILVQKYSGDVTIVPDMSLLDYANLITNPNAELTEYFAYMGERATWPKVPLIQNHVKIEICIDRALHRLKARQFTFATTVHNSESELQGSHSGVTTSFPVEESTSGPDDGGARKRRSLLRTDSLG
ncbi:acyl transferase/acyl hydrolase/lysophospholipase [Chytriomyces sp. MP71]|nr:acyl transferase/acyl hydrolase/lysophospholipase [Chytriomyces sp. MP71]